MMILEEDDSKNETVVVDPTEHTDHDDDDTFSWTTVTILQSIALFGLAGLAEIIGGWMVWVVWRGHQNTPKPWWYAFVGCILLAVYGFIPLLQPTDSFGRLYAAYGGFFIVLSFLLGWAFDGDRPDTGDVVGGTVALLGACLVIFWPRK
jgi:drug/metabolite transporter superfamily protein YnfA